MKPSDCCTNWDNAMTSFQIDIQITAIVTAMACAMLGGFLVLRRMAMLTDAISHTVLLGIVIGFFIVEDLTSPFLIFGAAAVGVLTVSLVALLERSRLVKGDAAIGLVYPVLFSIAVILISRFAGDVHLDTDAVLVGELAFIPFDRLHVFGFDIGPRGFYLMGGIFLFNLAFIVLLYKELKLSTFDAGLATALGFMPLLIHYVLMSLVSVTVVGAFDIVGSVLVVALMVAPPAAAYLLTDHLPRMLALSALLGALSAIIGYWVAHFLDASIAGSIATIAGVIFALAYLFAPEKGLLALARRRARQKWEFAQTMLVMHLLNHEGMPEAQEESRVAHLREHMRWDDVFAQRVLQRSLAQGWVTQQGSTLYLTEQGRQRAQQAFLRDGIAG
jgi:manganese/zinc/iron transport system permease protein